MSTATDERTDLELIEHLDWKHVPPCESQHHGRDSRVHHGPAYALISFKCPHCGLREGAGYRCRPFVEYVLGGGLLRCDAPNGCQQLHKGGMTVLGYVNGAS